MNFSRLCARGLRSGPAGHGTNIGRMTRAFIAVDVQNDFCPGGALATDRGDEVAEGIAALLADHREDYAFVVATQDWHIDPGTHFSTEPDFVDTWPVHCVADSGGAAMRGPLTDYPFDEYFHKGEYEAAYSGFEGTSTRHAADSGTGGTSGDGGDSGDRGDGVLLADWLRDHGVDTLDVAGIATDHCVRATVLDGLKEGFGVRVLAGLCSPVDDARGRAALDEMRDAGAKIVPA